MNRHFTTDDIQMAEKHVKRCLAPLDMKTQVSTTKWYRCPPVTMVKVIFKLTVLGVGKDAEQLEFSRICDRNT